MLRIGCVFLAVALLTDRACLAQTQRTSGSALENPWQDARLIRWSGEMNAGQFDEVLHEVELDLVSPSPHPFDIDIWCRLHLRQHDLDKAANAISDPALKQALGVAPRIYSLYDAGKTGELRRLREELPTREVHGWYTYRFLIDNAMDSTEFDRGFDLALQALRTQDPNFQAIWLTINLAEHDLRVRDRLEDLLKKDLDFAAKPTGKALAGMLAAEAGASANTSCRNRVADADRQFVSVADGWLAAYPGDAAAYYFRATHEGDLNADRAVIAKDVDAALASYPLLNLAGYYEALRADLINSSGKYDDAGLLLAKRRSVFESSIPAEQRVNATVDLSGVMRDLSGCGVSPRTTAAREWVAKELESTPAEYQAPLDAELGALDMSSPEKPVHAQAVTEARRALALHKGLYNTTLLIQALERDGSETENTEALQLYRTAVAGFPDHSEAFYDAGDTALGSLGSCEERLANWRTALVEFPNATWAMNGKAIAEVQCSHTQDALKTVQAMLEIDDDWLDSTVSTLQTAWAETGGMGSLDAHREQLFREHPKRFQGLQNPQTPSKQTQPITERQLELVAQTPPVSQLAKMTVSADGRLAAVAESDGVVSLWALNVPAESHREHGRVNCDSAEHAPRDSQRCGVLLRRIVAHAGRIADFAFSTDGKYLVTVGEATGTVKVWDVASGGEVWRVLPQAGAWPAIAVRHGSEGQNSLALLFRVPSDTSQSFSASGWSSILLCSFDTKSSCITTNWYSNKAFGTRDDGALAWSADGGTLLARVSENETLIVDVQSMQLVKNVVTSPGAAYKPDLSAELDSSQEGNSVSLKTRRLAVDAKAATVVSAKGTLLDKEYLANGTIRFAMEGGSEAMPDKREEENAPKSTPTPQTIQILEAPDGAGGGSTKSKTIATIGLTQFPIPVLRFSHDASDRLTVFSAQDPDLSHTPSTFAIGMISSGIADGIDLVNLPSQWPPIPNTVAFSRDGRALMVSRGTGNSNRLDVWDLANAGEPVAPTNTIAVGKTFGIAGSRFWTCSETGSSTYGMVAYRMPDLHVEPGEKQPCAQDELVAVAADGSAVAWLDGPDSVHVLPTGDAPWETGSIADLDLIKALAVRSNLVVAATKGRLLTAQRGKTAVDACDTPQAPCPTKAAFSAVALSGDGRYAAAAIGPDRAHTVPAPGGEYGVLVSDLVSGSVQLQVENPQQSSHSAVTAVAFVPNSTMYAAGTVMGHVFLADASNASFRKRIGTENSPVAAMNFSADGHLLAVALESGTISLFRIGSDGAVAELAHLDNFGVDNWSVVDPETQQYDASDAGKLSDLLWVYGTSTIKLDQMISNFYRDHLLPKLLAYDPIPVRPSPKLDPLHIDMPPDIRFVSLQPELVLTSDTPIQTLYSQHKIRVLVNNSPLGDAEMKIGSDGLLHAAILQHHTYAPGRQNSISVYVGNNSDTIDSRGVKTTIEDTGQPATNQAQQFYAIIAGISDYATQDLKSLPLADSDARAMSLAVARGAGHLVGDPAQVHLLLLTSNEQQGKQAVAALQAMGVTDAAWLMPSDANFQNAFRKVVDAHLHADDIFLMFLAGHGMVLDQNGQESYAYPTREITDIRNPASGTYLSEQELQQRLKDIGASHTILLFDTCDSGNFRDDTLRVDSIKGLNHQSFEDSIQGIMGAAPNADAYDSMEVGHGFLTNSLLAGMRESLNGNDLLAWNWLRGAGDRTWEVARFFGLKQQPVELGRRDNLEIAKLPRNELECIPDVEILPLIKAPQFHRKDGGDDLNLSDAVANHWKMERDSGATKPTVMYSDGTSPQARISMYGEYSTDGGQFTMNVKVFYGSSTPATEFPVSVPYQADAPDPNTALQPALNLIVEKVEAYAQQLTAERKPWTAPSSCFARLNAMNGTGH